MRITKKDRSVIIVTALVILVVAIAVGYLYVIKGIQESSTTPDKNLPKTSADSEHADWNTYTNEKYGFQVQFPDQTIDLNIPQIFDATVFSQTSSVYDRCTKEKIYAQGVSFCPIRSVTEHDDMVMIDNKYIVRNGSSYYTVSIKGEYGTEGSCNGIPDCADYGTVKEIFEQQILPTFIFIR